MQSLLLTEKKTVGFFTSPHLVKMNERIRINGEEISDEMFLNTFDYCVCSCAENESRWKTTSDFFSSFYCDGDDCICRQWGGVQLYWKQDSAEGGCDKCN